MKKSFLTSVSVIVNATGLQVHFPSHTNAVTAVPLLTISDEEIQLRRKKATNHLGGILYANQQLEKAKILEWGGN